MNFECGSIADSGLFLCVVFVFSPHIYMSFLLVQLEVYLGYYPVGALGLMSC